MSATLPSYVEDRSGGYVLLTNAWVERWLPVLTGYAVSVYIVLKKVGGQKHRCFYGLRALEKMAGQSRERLLKSIAELEGHGLLVVERSITTSGDAGTNTYYITQTSADTGEVVRPADHPGDADDAPSATAGGVVRRADHLVRRADHGGAPDEPRWCATPTTVVRPADQIQLHTNNCIPNNYKKTATTTAPPKAAARMEDDVVVSCASTQDTPMPATKKTRQPRDTGFARIGDILGDPVKTVSQVIDSAARAARREETAQEADEAAVMALVGAGVATGAAKRLASKHDAQDIERRIAAWRKGDFGKGVGALIRAIEQEWAIKPQYAAQEQQTQRQQAQQRTIEHKRAQEQEESASLLARFKGLPAPDQEQVRRRALALLPPKAREKADTLLYDSIVTGTIVSIMRHRDQVAPKGDQL